MKKHGRTFPGWQLLLSFPLFALLILAIQSMTLSLVQVKGASMTPTFHEGQVLLVNRMAYGIRWPIIGQDPLIWNPPHSGDLVVIQRPDSDKSVVKRVLATAGDPLRIVDHRLVAPSGEVVLTESQEYWLSACSVVPPLSLFVVGDNASESLDSRDWGFVPFDHVVGTPWP